jgi:AraC family transcriptional regulator
VSFVQGHLHDEITVAEMADAAGYSLYHFCRVFNRTIHHTPYDYLMRRRLSECARALLESDQRILDIALAYGFNSHETFTRAFKRMFEMPPSHWRAQGHKYDRRLMPQLTPDYIRHINQGQRLRPVRVDEDAFCVAGLMSRLPANREGARVLWQTLAKELSVRTRGTTPTQYYGVAYYPADWAERGCFYLAGIRVPSEQLVHPALVVKTVATQTYARFAHQGGIDDLALSLAYIYHTWLPQSDQRLACLIEVEAYEQDPTRASCTLIDIPIREG